MSSFNINNIIATNLQTGDGNYMSISHQSNVMQWDILEKEFQRLLQKGNWNSEQMELLREGEKAAKQKDKAKLKIGLKEIGGELLLQLSKAALVEIVKILI